MQLEKGWLWSLESYVGHILQTVQAGQVEDCLIAAQMAAISSSIKYALPCKEWQQLQDQHQLRVQSSDQKIASMVCPVIAWSFRKSNYDDPWCLRLSQKMFERITLKRYDKRLWWKGALASSKLALRPGCLAKALPIKSDGTRIYVTTPEVKGKPEESNYNSFILMC